LPYRTGDADPTQPPDARTLVEAGCSPLGCVLGPWIRVGWNAGVDDEGEIDAPLPATRLPLPSGVGRWHLQCRSSSRSSEVFVAERGRGALTRMRADLVFGAESSVSWEPFWEWKPPRLSHDEAGY